MDKLEKLGINVDVENFFENEEADNEEIYSLKEIFDEDNENG